jgi:hypothetical protein
MAMRGLFAETDLWVSQLDASPLRVGGGDEGPYAVYCSWAGRWNPQPGIVHTVMVCT